MESSANKTRGSTDYKKLRVWISAQALSKLVHKLSCEVPLRLHYSLADQMRRSALSVPSNIAEGMGRGTNRECIHFLFISQGSLKELESQVESAVEGRLIAGDEAGSLASLLKSTKRNLGGLIYVRCKRLKSEGLKPPRLQRPRSPEGP